MEASLPQLLCADPGWGSGYLVVVGSCAQELFKVLSLSFSNTILIQIKCKSTKLSRRHCFIKNKFKQQ